MPFRLLTCNVLADSYIRREWYPHTPDEWLTSALRHPALAAQLAQSGADILCLQEIEEPVFALLQKTLGALGYTGARMAKGGHKPDGCATFWRNTFTLDSQRRLEYHDAAPGRPASGHIAQLTVLRDGDHRLGIANTHLKWAPPEKAPADQYGLAQIRELIATAAAQTPPCDAWIFCGDFNVTPDTPVIAVLTQAGYLQAHRDLPQAYTAAPNREPRVIDYLFHSATLFSIPQPPPAITGATPLPGPEHPSDHLAISARFAWR